MALQYGRLLDMLFYCYVGTLIRRRIFFLVATLRFGIELALRAFELR